MIWHEGEILAAYDYAAVNALLDQHKMLPLTAQVDA